MDSSVPTLLLAPAPPPPPPPLHSTNPLCIGHADSLLSACLHFQVAQLEEFLFGQGGVKVMVAADEQQRGESSGDEGGSDGGGPLDLAALLARQVWLCSLESRQSSA